jgi:SAM-dependent methyltransferase
VDEILRSLGTEQVVLDLGCGSGSFQYSAYRCKIVGIDTHLERNELFASKDRVLYLRANSHALPLETRSVDFVVCNHSLEHIEQLNETLDELSRVLKPDGFVWISVPDGFGMDDRLYRFLYVGGGHVNRFTFPSLKAAVEGRTGMALLKSNVLTSSFIYCKRFPASTRPYLPRRLKILQTIGLVGRFGNFQLNFISRLLDRMLHSRLSQYGWGFLFGRPGTSLNISLPSYFNVCAGCGSGHAINNLRPITYRHWGLRFYRCPRCNESNVLFEPPKGFD